MYHIDHVNTCTVSEYMYHIGCVITCYRWYLVDTSHLQYSKKVCCFHYKCSHTRFNLLSLFFLYCHIRFVLNQNNVKYTLKLVSTRQLLTTNIHQKNYISIKLKFLVKAGGILWFWNIDELSCLSLKGLD